MKGTCGRKPGMNLLTPCSTALLEKFVATLLVKRFPAFYSRKPNLIFLNLQFHSFNIQLQSYQVNNLLKSP
jgi:hypothetical protein